MSKMSTKSFYLARLRRQKQICVFPLLAKIQNGHHFWGKENFLKIAKSTLANNLWVKTFDEIALSDAVREIEANLYFCIFGKNSKWPPFLSRGNVFENCKE